MDPIRILIADDHAFFRNAITPPLEEEPAFELVGFAENGDEAVRMARSLDPDVILMDLRMPYLSGLAALKRISPNKRGPAVLIITGSDYRDEAVEVLAAGAAGYLRKDNISDELLVSAIFAVASGGVFLDPDLFTDFLPILLADRPQYQADLQIITALSPDEVTLLTRVAQGWENTEIAKDLAVAPKTVSNRLGMLYEKLGVENRVQAALFALRNGLTRLKAID